MKNLTRKIFKTHLSACAYRYSSDAKVKTRNARGNISRTLEYAFRFEGERSARFQTSELLSAPLQQLASALSPLSPTLPLAYPRRRGAYITSRRISPAGGNAPSAAQWGHVRE